MASSKKQHNPSSSQSSTAGLFDSSLDSTSSFPNFSGPRLFTPAPAAPVSQFHQVPLQSTNQQPAAADIVTFSPSSSNSPRILHDVSSFPPMPVDPMKNLSSSIHYDPMRNMTPQQTLPVLQSTNLNKSMSPPPLSSVQLSSPSSQRPMQIVAPQPKSTSITPMQPMQTTTTTALSPQAINSLPSNVPSNVPASMQPTDPSYIKSFSPVEHHWFYLKNWTEWTPFSYYDSRKIEYAYQSKTSTIIPIEGGRFDVSLISMQRTSVYWQEPPCQIQRCSWFFKGDTESKLTPYNAEISEKLEKEYMAMMSNGIYNIRVNISDRDFIIFHNPNVLVHYVSNIGDNLDWTGEDSKIRPKVVKRGVTEVEKEIENGEPDEADHLVFVVHGIGPVADIRMRSIVECVNDFRKNSLDLSQTHEIKVGDRPANRIEFLPIQWHTKLREDRSEVDRQLKSLSLPSIMKLRSFTNETLTDILFYTSPTYCQAICDTIVSEMNRLYRLFKSRNPRFNGSISLVGHSLGSCILFDILANQETAVSFPKKNKEGANPPKETYEDFGETIDMVTKKSLSSPIPQQAQTPVDKSSRPSIEELLRSLGLSNLLTLFTDEQIDTDTLMMCSEADLCDLDIPFGPRKKLVQFIKKQENIEKGVPSNVSTNASTESQNSVNFLTRGTQTAVRENDAAKSPATGSNHDIISVNYPKLDFRTDCLFCFGSPLGLFLTCRGVSTLGLDYKLPTCKKFINIFHPYDPVVYRLEPLINPAIDIQPVLIPHHKGRKRFHLELKENISRVSANLKSGFLDAVNRTWSSINDFARAHRTQQGDNTGEQTSSNIQVHEQKFDEKQLSDSMESAVINEPVFDYGSLNAGKRIDYVLQEKPFEILNEYIFALSSHSCYWTSEDTALLLLNEVYKT